MAVGMRFMGTRKEEPGGESTQASTYTKYCIICITPVLYHVLSFLFLCYARLEIWSNQNSEFYDNCIFSYGDLGERSKASTLYSTY
jgi:hypothetical protein